MISIFFLAYYMPLRAIDWVERLVMCWWHHAEDLVPKMISYNSFLPTPVTPYDMALLTGYSFGNGGGLKPSQTPSIMYLDIFASPLREADW